MKNWAIVEHWDTFHYATIMGGGYWLQICSIELGDYVSTTNNTYYFGCDCKMCYFTCAKGTTFQSVIIGRMTWSNLEGPHP
jgi:hypothetical protein